MKKISNLWEKFSHFSKSKISATANIEKIENKDFLKVNKIKELEKSNKIHTVKIMLAIIIFIAILFILMVIFSNSLFSPQYTDTQNPHYSWNNNIFTMEEQYNRLDNFVEGLPAFIFTLIFSGSAFYFAIISNIKKSLLKDNKSNQFEIWIISFLIDNLPYLVIFLLLIAFLSKVFSYFQTYILKAFISILAVTFSALFIFILLMEIWGLLYQVKKMKLLVAEINHTKNGIRSLKLLKEKVQNSTMANGEKSDIHTFTFQELFEFRNNKIQYLETEVKTIEKALNDNLSEPEKRKLIEEELIKIEKLSAEFTQYQEKLTQMLNKEVD